MEHAQFYKYSTWGLLLLNLSMVGLFLLTANPPPQGAATGEQKAVDILRMDEQQDETFLQLVRQHIQLMDDFSNQEQKLLQPYFYSLIDQNIANNSDSLLNQVLLLERKKIESVYQHFQHIKSILRPNQLGNFAAFNDHVVVRILMEQKKPTTSASEGKLTPVTKEI